MFIHVALPSAKPALATVALFSFIGHWNDFLGPHIYTNSMEKKTLAVGLNAFKGTFGRTDWNLMMAASATVMLPVIVLFLVGQRYFIQGIVTTGLSGR